MLFTQNLWEYVFNNFPTVSNITMVFVRKLSGMRWLYYYAIYTEVTEVSFQQKISLDQIYRGVWT